MDFNPMIEAIRVAKMGAITDRVPVGCVLVYQGNIVAEAHNGHAPFEHAESLVIQKAYQKIGENIRDASLYVTLEPCAMCCAMIALCHIQKVIFGAYDTKNGGIDHYRPIHLQHLIGGVMEKECGDLLTQYFKKKRLNSKSVTENFLSFE